MILDPAIDCKRTTKRSFRVIFITGKIIWRGRKAQRIIDAKKSALPIKTSIATTYSNNAEGGTRIFIPS
jgi:hypothetical protein